MEETEPDRQDQTSIVASLQSAPWKFACPEKPLSQNIQLLYLSGTGAIQMLIACAYSSLYQMVNHEIF